MNNYYALRESTAWSGMWKESTSFHSAASCSHFSLVAINRHCSCKSVAIPGGGGGGRLKKFCVLLTVHLVMILGKWPT